MLHSNLGERTEAVQLGDEARCRLDMACLCQNFLPELYKEVVFQLHQALLGT